VLPTVPFIAPPPQLACGKGCAGKRSFGEMMYALFGMWGMAATDLLLLLSTFGEQRAWAQSPHVVCKARCIPCMAIPLWLLFVTEPPIGFCLLWLFLRFLQA
jgi:hypothetical protein